MGRTVVWEQAEEELEKALQKRALWVKGALDEGNLVIQPWEPFVYHPKMGGDPDLFNHLLDLSRMMRADSQLPNDEQRKKLCDMLHHALVHIRMLAASGHGDQASDLADAFHNLPQEIWCDYFSISFFRDAFLVPYYRKWPLRQPRDYLALLDEVERLK